MQARITENLTNRPPPAANGPILLANSTASRHLETISSSPDGAATFLTGTNMLSSKILLDRRPKPKNPIPCTVRFAPFGVIRTSSFYCFGKHTLLLAVLLPADWAA